MIVAALALAVLSPADGATQCQYDRSAMLALDLAAFDQDMNGDGGRWKQKAASWKLPI